MRRCLYVSIFALVLGACSTTPLANKQPPDVTEQLQAAEQLLTQDYPRALAEFRRITAMRQFNALPAPLRLQVLSRAANAEANHGDKLVADRYLLRAAAMPEADAQLHLRHALLASYVGRPAEALDELTASLKRWPDSLPTMDSRMVEIVKARANELPHDATIPLLQTLYALHWTDKYGNEPGAWWCELSLFYLQHGSLKEALEVSNRIEDPTDIALIRVDRRYAALLAANPARFDIDAAAAAWMRKLRDLAEQHPRMLRDTVAVLEALLAFRHYSAALASTDSVVAEIESTNSPEKLYDDFKDQQNWLLDYRSRALVHLGRYEDAVADLARAGALFEDGQSNVSQNINLAQLDCKLGRPRDALAVLRAMVGSTSPYGVMQIEQVRLDAAAQLGDTKEQARSLAYLRTHRRDAPATYLSALLVLGDMDGAARWQIERLRNSKFRSDALMQSQHYAQAPQPQRSLEFNARLDALVSRPDVQAAIHAVGRQESFQFTREDYD